MCVCQLQLNIHASFDLCIYGHGGPAKGRGFNPRMTTVMGEKLEPIETTALHRHRGHDGRHVVRVAPIL